MNLLIVDDEIQTVRAIKFSVSWNELGIQKVFASYNVAEAKSIIMENHVDIVLCDIEMPLESGFDLIEWQKRNAPYIEDVIISCHEKFTYAKKAISLGSFDYLVKPITMENLKSTIIKLTAKIKTRNSEETKSRYGDYWLANQSLIEQDFWRDLLTGKITGDLSQIGEVARKRNVDFRQDDKYLLVLISLKQINTQLEKWDSNSIFYAIKNVATELIIGDLNSNTAVNIDDCVVLILSSDNTAIDNTDLEKVQSRCSEFVYQCGKSLGCSTNCYIGKMCFGEQLADVLKKMRAIDADNVSGKNKVYTPTDQIGEKNADEQQMIPQIENWLPILRSGDRSIVEISTNYLKKLDREHRLDSHQLKRFHQDILQLVYSFLSEKGIQASLMFRDKASQNLFRNAAKSLEDMINWISYFIPRALEYAQEAEKSQSIIDKAVGFIQSNLGRELTREEIANYVYLNPDYLSRRFKREKGITLSEYIMIERIKRAKELIAGTEKQISNIATDLGYDNVSYFCSIFKKSVGMTPLEYRNCLHRSES